MTAFRRRYGLSLRIYDEPAAPRAICLCPFCSFNAAHPRRRRWTRPELTQELLRHLHAYHTPDLRARRQYWWTRPALGATWLAHLEAWFRQQHP